MKERSVRARGHVTGPQGSGARTVRVWCSNRSVCPLLDKLPRAVQAGRPLRGQPAPKTPRPGHPPQTPQTPQTDRAFTPAEGNLLATLSGRPQTQHKEFLRSPCGRDYRAGLNSLAWSSRRVYVQCRFHWKRHWTACTSALRSEHVKPTTPRTGEKGKMALPYRSLHHPGLNS